MIIRTDGIVIREKEAATGDKHLTLLTRQAGVLTAFAGGGKSPKNKNVSSTDLLCYSDFSIDITKKGNCYIKEATPKSVFFDLRRDIVTLCLAQYLAELTSELAPRAEEAGEFLPLILNCMHLLCTGSKEREQIKAVAELRMLTLAGYMPQLVGCNKCGIYESEKMYFDTFSGELFCESCRPAVKLKEISMSTLSAMRHICLSDSNKIFSFTLSPEAMLGLTSVAEKYLLSVTGKRFKTLDFYKKMTEY